METIVTALKENIVLIIISLASPIVTIIGLILNNRVSMRTAEAETKKTKAEAERIEAEADKLRTEDLAAQISYYSSVVSGLRSEIATITQEAKVQKERIETLEKRLADAIIEKELIAKENFQLKLQLDVQEREIEKLRQQVTALENANNNNIGE